MGLDLSWAAIEATISFMRREHFLWIPSVFLICGCASKVMQFKGDSNIDVVSEFDELVKIEKTGKKKEAKNDIHREAEVQVKLPPRKIENMEIKKRQPVKPKVFERISRKMKKAKLIEEKDIRLPKIEPSDGFDGRRPLIDPYREGEKVELDVSYFKVSAGTLTLETHPMVEVNGKKAYHFSMRLKSSRVFSMFYSVDDFAETHLDYEELTPLSYQLHVKESKQLKEVRTFFDWKALKAHHWEKKITKEHGEEKSKKVWEIPAFSQNSLSAVFYLRNFQLIPGKKIRFHIANEGENLILTAKVIKKETLSTEVGDLKTVMVKLEFKVDGVFKTVGDVFFWFTDDKRRLLVQIESEIKVGKIVGRLRSLKR